MNTKDSITKKCKEIEVLLHSKNDKYGDAALQPSMIFSQCNASMGLKVRIDDKLKRIQTGSVLEDEDTLLDLIGYLILLMIARDNENNDVQKRLRKDEAIPYISNSSNIAY